MGRWSKKPRMRRAYLKRFTQGTVNTGPNKHYLREVHNRTKTIGNNEWSIDVFCKVFSIPKVTMLLRYTVGRHQLIDDPNDPDHGQPISPRVRVERQIKEFMSNVPTPRNINLGMFKLWFSEDSTQWFFTKQDLIEITRSITYGSRWTAMKAFEDGKIVWKERMPI
jgi:hypothetical protein